MPSVHEKIRQTPGVVPGSLPPDEPVWVAIHDELESLIGHAPRSMTGLIDSLESCEADAQFAWRSRRACTPTSHCSRDIELMGVKPVSNVRGG